MPLSIEKKSFFVKKVACHDFREYGFCALRLTNFLPQANRQILIFTRQSAKISGKKK
jgi:hypothetical protein